MQQVRLILVGGFLGAGKTTLLRQAAKRLMQRGHNLGLITNDQAADLVDTGILRGTGAAVEEVAGGCFCCRFDDLIGSLKSLFRQAQPDLLIGEPVGSCTDISATVVQPLKALYGELFRIAPLTVLVEPARLSQLLGPGESAVFPDTVLHILRTQLEEADIIVLNKSDLLPAAEIDRLRATLSQLLPGRLVLVMSARQGFSVDAWLDLVLSDLPAGVHLAEVDYDTYAAGEAALGWLNATASLTPACEVDWQALILGLLERIRSHCREHAAEIAHLKVLVQAGSGALTASLTSTTGEAAATGEVAVGNEPAELVVNARIGIDPDQLRDIVFGCLEAECGTGIELQMTHLESFRPARPEPTHRYGRVVGEQQGPETPQ